ncbi:hypothetical protein [Porphyromonas uenonis]|uniref:hypothetical protein n=1 Tax=Porphyromonas uenonis TaxID=281920 RepID=UPI0012FDC23E|nr:hypothetical protein [Porphyromonas uenonis]
MTELDMYYNNATKLMMIHQPQAKVLNSGVPRHVLCPSRVTRTFLECTPRRPCFGQAT